MTVTPVFPSRGAPNPDTRSDGREQNIEELAAAVNSLIVNNIQAEDIFGVNAINTGVNVNLSALETTQYVNLTASGVTLRLPQANVTASMLYGGGRYVIHNETYEYSLDVDNFASAAVTNVAPRQTVELVCLSATTSPGLLRTNRYFDRQAAATMQSLNFLSY